METKVCKRCNVDKNLNFYYKDKIGKFGNSKYIYYRNICKECDRKQKIEYRKLPTSKEIRRNYEKVYNKKRRKIDPSFKLKKDISSIVRRVLHGDKNNYSLWKILPYNSDELKSHLENQFDENMSWNNHGIYWQIDHIIPQSALIYDSMLHPNFIKCWSLSNLKPLKSEDNLKKSSIYGDINYKYYNK